jgi:hypothetical protein
MNQLVLPATYVELGHESQVQHTSKKQLSTCVILVSFIQSPFEASVDRSLIYNILEVDGQC